VAAYLVLGQNQDASPFSPPVLDLQSINRYARAHFFLLKSCFLKLYILLNFCQGQQIVYNYI
jgi:hypothetical protein